MDRAASVDVGRAPGKCITEYDCQVLLAKHQPVNHTTCPEQRLWKAVIVQALLDATAVRPTKRASERLARSRAIAWFNATDEDFVLVASLAGYEPKSLAFHMRGQIRKMRCTFRRRV